MRACALLLSLTAMAAVALPAAAQCTWVPGPTFPSGPRTAAAGLNHNGTLVVLGGRPFVGESASVHYLPPGATAWQTGVSIAEPLMQPAAGVDALGRIIVAGGYITSDHHPFFVPRTNAFVYDLVNGQGDGVAGMNVARAFYDFTTDADHRLYVIGGLDASLNVTDVVERYDAISDIWTILTPLPEARYQAAVAYDGNGHVLVIGGIDAAGSERATVFSYDVAGGTWTTVAPQPASYASRSAVLGANGLVYVIGGAIGNTKTRAVDIYHPTANEWTNGPNLLTARSGAAVALGDDAFVYAMGGFSGSLGTDTVEQLNTLPPGPGEDCNNNGIPDICESGLEPTIDSHPSGATVCDGGAVTFAVVASGAEPLNYQWRKDGVDITGATLDFYTIDPVSISDAGDYDVVVHNDCGSVTSDPATLTVVTGAPGILTQPQSQSVCGGDPVTFSVVASGSASLSYQWRKDGQPIAGATGSSYTIDPVGAGHAGVYDVLVTNPCGTTSSDPATLTVYGPVPGDMNCDGAVNAFDIDPFVLAVVDRAAYEAQFPNCDYLNGDVDCDGDVDSFDIDPFVELLAGG